MRFLRLELFIKHSDLLIRLVVSLNVSPKLKTLFLEPLHVIHLHFLKAGLAELIVTEFSFNSCKGLATFALWLGAPFLRTRQLLVLKGRLEQ